MKLHDRNLLMTQSNIQCITKKHHRIEKEVMKKGGKIQGKQNDNG